MRGLVLLVVSVAAFGVFGLAGSDADGQSNSGGVSADLLYAERGVGSGPFVFISASGGGRAVLIGEGTDPVWSPDGSRVAFITNRYTDDSLIPGELYVAGADGSWHTRLTFGSPPGLAKSAPAWSPDGASIAFLAGANGQKNVWTVPVAGGKPHRVTSSPGKEIGLAWSPTGSSLLTTQGGVVAVDAVSGRTTTLAKGTEPAWSPDGSRIAYVDRGGRVAVMLADGSSTRELGSVQAASPAWSPDGTHVIFTGLREQRDSYGSLATVGALYIAPADGSDAPLALPLRLDSAAEVPERPAFSPDDAQISFLVDDLSWLANADGTCAHAEQGDAPLDAGPFWRPDSDTGGALACVDLAVHPSIKRRPRQPGHWADVTLKVENNGNETAHDVVLHLMPATRTSEVHGCNASGARDRTCSFGELGTGRSQTVSVAVSSTRAGETGVRYSVTSTESDPTPVGNTGLVTTTFSPRQIYAHA